MNSKKKKIIISSIIVILILVISIIIFVSSKANTNTEKNNISTEENQNNESEKKKSNYSVTSNLHSVVKVKDDYFENQKDKKYEKYDLILVSFSLNNETNKNYNLDYNLSTKYNNEYNNVSGSYITTTDKYLVENFLDVSGHNYIQEKKLLGSENKHCILAYMVPQNEFKDDNVFNIDIEEWDYAKIEPIKFKTADIIESNTLKELFLEEELELMEQKISLYNTADHIINCINSQITAYNSNDASSLDLFLAMSIQVLKGSNFYLNWDTQYNDNDGYKLDYSKCKELLPSLTKDIEVLENSISIQEKVANALEKNKNVQSINYNEYTTNAYSLRESCINIKKVLKD